MRVFDDYSCLRKGEEMMKRRACYIFLLFLFISPGLLFPQAEASRKTPRPIEVEDILNWRNVGSSALSDDGRWFAYAVSSRTGFRELVIRMVKEKKEYRFPTDARGIQFSSDSRWLAFIIRPTEQEERELKRQKKKTYNKVGLVNLDRGEKMEFDKIESFSFSAENPDWIALSLYAPERGEKSKDQPKGITLILHELATSRELSIGNVSEFAFDRSGRRLAWLVDAPEQSGNGIQLREMASGRILSLDSDKALYSQLSWTDDGNGLIALKAVEDKDYDDRLYSLIGFRNFSNAGPERVLYEPREDPSFPKGMTISPNRKPEWTEGLDGFLFGIHPVKKKEAKETVGDEDLPDLVLWHWRDERLPTQQQVEEKADREFSYLCVYWVDGKKFVRLADEELKNVVPAPLQRFALGIDCKDYLFASSLDGKVFQDFYVIDMKSGQRQLAVRKNRAYPRPHWSYSLSPDGTHFLYYQDGHFYTFDVTSRQFYNITKDCPTSFINSEYTYNAADSPIEPVGWSKDGEFVLLYDNWDIWKVPVHGGRGVNLTVNGRKEGIRYQRRYVLDKNEKGINLAGPMYIQAYGERTKKAGIARIDEGKPGVKMFLWDDAVYYTLMKAKKSEAFLYSRETNDNWDTYISYGSLDSGIRMTNICAQQKDFLWSSGSMLVDYVSTKGDKLQAALFLPANYEKGKKYACIVDIYEKLSSWKNRYLGPGISAANDAFFNSHGYAILRPDILNRVDDPAMSAVWCVIPAVEAAIATGVVDRERVGVTGHSMGGWETAFLVTQTDLFAAAVAGAPLTDLISMYGSIYGSTGTANAPLFESSQARMSRSYIGNLDAYIRNSPVFHADKVKTPLLIMHNDKDKAVDWNQGVEYFNILRRLEKPVIMLQYKGEGHSLQKFPNRLDYCIRTKEFFDHFLLGKPAPRWLEEGISLLEMKNHLQDRMKKYYDFLDKGVSQ
jgi:dipeptidyl aminopeptidase/acylaminoacyl peptidase